MHLVMPKAMPKMTEWRGVWRLEQLSGMRMLNYPLATKLRRFIKTRLLFVCVRWFSLVYKMKNTPLVRFLSNLHE